MTTKEIYHAMYHRKPYSGIPNRADMISIYMPGEHFLPENSNETVGPDWFGTYWSLNQGELGGDTIYPGRYRLNEIAEWESEQVIPARERYESFDWEGYFNDCCKGRDYKECFVRVVITCGFFERLHMLLGFENAMCELYDSPDEVKAFIRAMVEFKKMEVDYVAEHFHPDVISFHDDYGTERQMFISPAMWHEFFEDAVREIVAYMHEKGLYVQFHSCGYIMDIVGTLVDCGVDALEIQDVNDLAKIKAEYGDRVVLVTGLDPARPKALGKSDEEIEEQARELYEKLMVNEGFVPKFLAHVAAEFHKE